MEPPAWEGALATAWAGLAEAEASLWEGVSDWAEDLAEDLAGAKASVEDSAEGGGQRPTLATTGWLTPIRAMVTPTTIPMARGAGIRFLDIKPVPEALKVAMARDRAGVSVR